MKHDRASKGSRGSASQWNGFLDMHKAFYGNTVGQGMIPPILQSSTIVPATLKKGESAIGAYQPVRIVKNFGFKNVVDTMPSYEVEPVDAVDGERHGNYGFTLGEGVTEANGGRIVIGGLAIVAMDAGELYFDKTDAQKEGSFDSAYYMVPDETLSNDLRLIAPVGHYKLVSWYDPTVLGGFEASDRVYIAIDMSQRPTSFNATTTEDVAAATEASDIFTWESAAATPMFPSDQTSVANLEMDISSDEDAYEIQVYNGTGAAVQIGEHLVSYSLEYNRFIIASAGSQTSKIGKADADITAGSTGTVSIWRDGADTTENIEDVELDWMHGGTKVSSGKQVMITFFADEGIWRITGAECED